MKIQKYISEVSNELINEINSNDRILIEAPTGSGKSEFVLESLPKYYNKILVVSPIRLVTEQHREETAFEPLVTLADTQNKSYLAVTTDTLYNLFLQYPTEVTKYLSEVPLVAFDEQHIIENSFGFRPKVLKVVELLESSVTKLIYLSGTPDFTRITPVTHIRVVANKNYNVTVFNNIFKDSTAVTTKVTEELKKGSVLFYVASTTKVTEVENIFKNIKNSVILSTQGAVFNGKTYDNIKELPKTGNKLFISTSRATAGLNFKGLVAVFQYGSIYNTNNLVQLMSRLRTTGNYYYIKPRYENNLQDLRINQLESLLTVLQPNFNLARDFYTVIKPLVDTNEIVLSSATANGFIKAYSKALELAEALNWIFFNKTKDDFIVTEIKDFNGAKNRLRKKYTDKIIVDSLIDDNNFEVLNDSYNLSFTILLDKSAKVLPKRVELITIEDKIARTEKNSKKKIAEVDSLGKTLLVQVLPIKDLRKNFTADELCVLAKNKSISVDKLTEIENNKARVVALRCYLIPKRTVFGIISKLMANKDFIKVLDVDAELSKLYSNSSKLSKYPYVQFIINLLESELNNSQYVYRASINNKKYGSMKRVIFTK